MKTVLTDIELIMEFQQTRDDSAFNEILKRYNKFLKKLYYQFFNLLCLGITADELEQEILISFFNAVQKYNPDRVAKFSTYCWQHINHDLCDLYSKQINQYKHIVDNKITIRDADDVDTELDLLSSIPDPIDISEYYQENLNYREIIDYIKKLDDVTKNIYTTYLCSGLTQKQIASQYGVSQMYVSRVIKNLNNHLHQIILAN